MDIRVMQQQDFDSIVTLWERCYFIVAGEDSELNLERKWNYGKDFFLVAEVNGIIVGTVMGGYNGYRGSAHYLCVHPDYRGRGIANALMNRLEKKLMAKGCSVIEVALPEEQAIAIELYEKLDYENQEAVCLRKQLL